MRHKTKFERAKSKWWRRINSDPLSIPEDVLSQLVLEEPVHTAFNCAVLLTSEQLIHCAKAPFGHILYDIRDVLPLEALKILLKRETNYSHIMELKRLIRGPIKRPTKIIKRKRNE